MMLLYQGPFGFGFSFEMVPTDPGMRNGTIQSGIILRCMYVLTVVFGFKVSHKY